MLFVFGDGKFGFFEIVPYVRLAIEILGDDEVHRYLVLSKRVVVRKPFPRGVIDILPLFGRTSKCGIFLSAIHPLIDVLRTPSFFFNEVITKFVITLSVFYAIVSSSCRAKLTSRCVVVKLVAVRRCSSPADVGSCGRPVIRAGEPVFQDVWHASVELLAIVVKVE